MNAKKNGETKSPPSIRSLRSFFVDTFTRLKHLFTRPKSNLPNAGTGNTVYIETPDTEEQKSIVYDSPYLLMLPPGIRRKFSRLASARTEVNPPLLNHAGNHSTLALLHINNVYFWGSNNVESPLTPRDLNDLRATLKYEKSFPAYSPFLVHPEADAILKAFRQKMTADRATMFIERKQCNTCGQREFNSTHLRRLLPVLRLKELTVFTTNSMGRITKLVLSPLSSGTGHQNSW